MTVSVTKVFEKTVFTLLDHGVLPIMNENDTVTTDDLKVGDNDNLSAMVAAAADADALMIFSGRRWAL